MKVIEFKTILRVTTNLPCRIIKALIDSLPLSYDCNLTYQSLLEFIGLFNSQTDDVNLQQVIKYLYSLTLIINIITICIVESYNHCIVSNCLFIIVISNRPYNNTIKLWINNLILTNTTLNLS